jgi:SAM-dependent methyltransferase
MNEHDPDALDALMRESAALALRLAQQHCPAPTADDPGCAWYHGFWQIPRLMGIGKSTGGQAAFLLAALRAHARAGDFGRVLVSGTADYAMPALVHRAYRSEGARLELTVVDRCETPLRLCAWYAQKSGESLRAVRSNILDLRESGSFDLVLTNSFLGYFDPRQRQQLFAVWADLLRPGGKVVFSNRVRPGFDAGRVGFGPDEARRFCAEVDARAEAAGRTLGIEPERIASGAREYVRRFEVYPVTSHDALHESLRQAGFARIDADVSATRAARVAISGPSTTEQGVYARIVATRKTGCGRGAN